MDIITKNNSSFDSSLDLGKRLNLNYSSLTTKSYPVGDRDLLHLPSPFDIEVDYLALYSKPSEYNTTRNTAVSFYEYDDVFDCKNGLWNAIYYRDFKLIDKFKKRFQNVRSFISPDYTLCADGYDACNAYAIQKSRIVSLWLIHECSKPVIPNITYAGKKSLSYFLDGLEDCSVVAFSTKGLIKNRNQRNMLIEAVGLTISKLKKLKKIYVYSTCRDDTQVLELFGQAIGKGIEVIVPDNLLKRRNLLKRGEQNGEI